MLKREDNLKNREEDLTFVSETVKAFPTQYYIAVSVACDIQCPYCPRQYYKEETARRAGFMDFEKFKKAAPYLRYADYAGFFGLGEPFLNKRFFDFIAEAKSYGAYAATSTHGLSLTAENAEKIIELKMDEIAVSIDSPKRKTFEFLRHGAHFKTIVKNVKYLSKLKEKLKSKTPAIHIASTISSHNVKHIPDMVKFARDLGASRLVFTNLIIVDPENEKLSVAGSELLNSKIEKAMKIGKKIGLEILYFPQNPFPWVKKEREFPAGARFGCLEAWRTLAIEKDGSVRPCCYLEENFGNVFTDDIADIINNEQFKKLRRGFIEKELHPTCRSCANLQVIT